MDDLVQHNLSMYLTDHWAAAGGGVALAARVSRENADTPWAADLAQLAKEVAEDDALLQRVRTSIGSERGRVKRVLAAMGERVARLIPNGRLVHYSPLSRVLETEALLAGVWAKERMWVSLRDLHIDGLEEFDFATAAQRAGDQGRLLQRFHDWSAAVLLSPAIR